MPYFQAYTESELEQLAEIDGGSPESEGFYLPKLPKILVIDDDPVFNYIMKARGRNVGLEVDAKPFIYPSEEREHWDYDLAIIDYQLDSITGVELAKDIERSVGNIPVLLVSQSDRKLSRKDLPDVIKGFCVKEKGPSQLIFQAVELYFGA